MNCEETKRLWSYLEEEVRGGSGYDVTLIMPWLSVYFRQRMANDVFLTDKRRDLLGMELICTVAYQRTGFRKNILFFGGRRGGEVYTWIFICCSPPFLYFFLEARSLPLIVIVIANRIASPALPAVVPASISQEKQAGRVPGLATKNTLPARLP